MNAPLVACSVCFQVEHSATTDGLLAAVFVLVAVTVCVLAGVGAFVLRLARAERFSQPEPQHPTTEEPENLRTPEPENLVRSS